MYICTSSVNIRAVHWYARSLLGLITVDPEFIAFFPTVKEERNKAKIMKEKINHVKSTAVGRKNRRGW